MSVLTQILERKRERVELAKESVSLDSLQQQSQQVRTSSEPHKFLNAFESDGIKVIAEFKRKSPSKGVIRADVAIIQMVQVYQAGGAAALSILTEEDHFDGSLDDLRSVRSVVKLPILRKDFLFDEYQIFEAVVAGADAVLLIVAALDDKSLRRLRELAEDELGIDALVEVHNELEMKRAVDSGATLIGVNNRNLHTFEVSLQTSLQLASLAFKGSTLISESGLRNNEDLRMLNQAGYQGFLIGESLMRSENPGELLRSLIAG